MVSYLGSKKSVTEYVPVAQLDRVFGYEPKGRGFESPQAHHNKNPAKSSFFKFDRRVFSLYLPLKTSENSTIIQLGFDFRKTESIISTFF